MLRHKNTIQTISYIDNDNPGAKRELIAFNHYKFYKSSGLSSDFPKIWLPYVSLMEKAQGDYKIGYINKPQLANVGKNPPDELYQYCFGADLQLRGLLKKIDASGRFGNLEAMLISFALSEDAWKASSKLKELITYIESNTSFMEYITNIRKNHFHFQIEASISSADSKALTTLNDMLDEQKTYHDNTRNNEKKNHSASFPDYAKCIENIKKKPVDTLRINTITFPKIQIPLFNPFTFKLS
jgi:hypothetical protein